MKYVCSVCGWVYDEEKGLANNGEQEKIPFEELPDDFVCPVCGVGKENFEKEEQTILE